VTEAELPPGWELVSCKEGRYSVAFPVKPNVEASTPVDETVTPSVTSFTYSQLAFVNALFVYHVTYHTGREYFDPVRTLREQLNDIVESDHGLYERMNATEVWIAGVLGLDFTFSSSIHSSRHRIFIRDGGLLVQEYRGPKGTDYSPDAERYFSSLRFWSETEGTSNG
jgi:hypothetical protein